MDFALENAGGNPGSAESRIFRSQFRNLSIKFRDVFVEFNATQVEFRDKSRDALKRRMNIQGKEQMTVGIYRVKNINS